MFRIHRFFLRSALVCLLLGVGLGVFLQLERALQSRPHDWWVVHLHNHLLTVGFFMQMVMGVAQWMFPRRPGVPKDAPATDPLAWANWSCLNAGLLLRALVEPFHPSEGTGPLLAASAVLQGAGVLLFIVVIAPRIRGPWAFPGR